MDRNIRRKINDRYFLLKSDYEWGRELGARWVVGLVGSNQKLFHSLYGFHWHISEFRLQFDADNLC
jgi:hypothetical protein